MLFFAETVSQAQLASLEARHTVSSGADEERPNTAAAPLTRERAGTGIRRVVGGVVLPIPSLPPQSGSSCRSKLLTALHKKRRPASATCAGYREESNIKTSTDLRARIGRIARSGIGWAAATCFAGDHPTASRP